MGYNCLPTEPSKARKDEFPTKYQWVEITKEYRKPQPEKGKKRVDASILKEYNEMMDKRAKMFKQLETGYYNCFNNPIDGEEITKEKYCLFNDFSSYFYRVEPISSSVSSRGNYSYSSEKKDYKLYEFNIVKKCETPEELLSQLYKDHDLVEFMREVLDNGRYANEGYRDKCINWFKYCKDNFENFDMNLEDVIYLKYNHYEHSARYKKEDANIEALVIELVDNSYINLHDLYDHESTIFRVLIESNWFILARRYLETLKDEIVDKVIEYIKQDKSFENIKYILKTNGDNDNIKSIIKKLDYDEPKVTLNVYKNYDDFGYSKESDNPVDIKEFKTIDEVRSYLVSQYKIPFNQAAGDITDFEWKNSKYDLYHFVVE